MSQEARYTLAGSAHLEERIDRTVKELSNELGRILPRHGVRCVELVGGYGRGEGAIEVDADGDEYPHNDLDLVVIVDREGVIAPDELERAAKRSLRPITAREGLDLELSVVSTARLQKDDCRILWYEMHNGHRTLLGDAQYVRGLTRFRVERLLLEDARDLVLNRIALLAILSVLERRAGRAPEIPGLGVRYLWKAMLAVGDALLAYRGRYHFSTTERGRRLAAEPVAPAELKELYARALAFRSRVPRRVSLQEFGALRAEAIPVLRDAALLAEAVRLGRPGLQWEDLPEATLRHALLSLPESRRAALRRARNVVWAPRSPKSWPAGWRLGARAAGQRGRLALAAPAACLQVEELTRIAREILDAPRGPMEEAFLARWSAASERGLPEFLARFGVRLDI